MLHGILGSGANWRTIWESTPGLPSRPGIDVLESGGRLAWRGPHTLLLTVGDHSYDGVSPGEPEVAQDPTATYGKTMLIHPDGRAEIFATGMRNPQGILVAGDGRIWST